MLDRFLETWASRPFREGERDCALQVADWVRINTGIDPAADLRGRYSTPTGMVRLLRRRGGLCAVMTACAEIAGLEETAEPVRGDVGLIRLPGGQEVAGICTGRLWAVAASSGLFGSRAEVVRAWRIGHG